MLFTTMWVHSRSGSPSSLGARRPLANSTPRTWRCDRKPPRKISWMTLIRIDRRHSSKLRHRRGSTNHHQHPFRISISSASTSTIKIKCHWRSIRRRIFVSSKITTLSRSNRRTRIVVYRSAVWDVVCKLHLNSNTFHSTFHRCSKIQSTKSEE